jgi:CelD/BcsL family acetyltransferase involved in cellulose biosynthesis
MLLLKENEKIVGAQLMFVNVNSVMVYASGYDRDYYPNAGTFLLMSAIKQAIEEENKEFSFLKGKEHYKYEFGARDFGLYSVSIDL